MFINGKKALDYIENNELSQQEQIRLLGILTKQLNTFPLDNVIVTTPQGATLANGQEMSIEELVKFRQGISALQSNWAFQLLGDQILFEAIKWGVHNGDTTDRMMFSKTAIWFITKFRQYLVSFDVK
jgi:hypothetical protein